MAKNSKFPKEGLQFLRNLKRHNNRVWFQKHKVIYEESVRRPMELLVESMALEFTKFAPDIVASPKMSLYRINRDTRFAKDKSPYKTHVAAVFPQRGLEKHAGAGFYLHIGPDELLVGGGLYRPLPEDLRAVREHMAAHYGSFETIVHALRFRRMFGSLAGEQLSRVPRGFPADHQASHYLRFKQFLASRLFSPGVATTTKLHPTLVETFRVLYPLVAFLNEPIIQNRKAKQRQEAFLKT